MHQSIITKTKNYSCKDWIILDAIINHNITIFECYYNENKEYEKIEITSNFIQTGSLFLENINNNC